METSTYRFKDILASDVWQYSNPAGDRYSDNDYFLVQANRSYNADYPLLEKSGLEYQNHLSTVDATKGVDSIREIVSGKIMLESKCDLGGHYNCGSAQVTVNLIGILEGTQGFLDQIINYTACTSTAYAENFVELPGSLFTPANTEFHRRCLDPDDMASFYKVQMNFATVHEGWSCNCTKSGCSTCYSYPWVYLYIDQLLLEIKWKRKTSMFYAINF